MNMIIEPISAIPSWEGYEYQGHISLYIAIHQILEMVKTNQSEEITSYELGIEDVEDFTIIKDGKYISLHQVKKGAVSLTPSDKLCFLLSILQYESPDGFFHINTNETVPTDFVASTKIGIESLLADLNKPLISKEDFEETFSENGETKEEDYICIHKITIKATKGSLYRVLNYRCDQNKSEANILKIIQELKIELQEYYEKLEGKNDSDFWSVYQDKFDGLDSIISASCLLIKELLEINNPDGKMYYDTTFYEFVYMHIVWYLKKIVSNNNTPAKRNYCKLSFIEIYKLILMNYKADSNTPEYQFYELFQLIKEIYNKYPSTSSSRCEFDSCSICDNQESCNAYKEMNKIFSENYNGRREFLYKLLLRTPKNNLPREPVIRELFLGLIKHSNKLKYCDNKTILAEDSGNIYRLTLDENEYIEDFIDQLNTEKNSLDNDIFLIYENDVIITDRLEQDNVRYNQNGFFVMGDNELEEISSITTDSSDKQKVNYNKPKVMKFISKSKAIKELTGNE